MTSREIPVAIAQARLRYDPITGTLVWRERSAQNVFAGDQAGYVFTKGYRIITLDGVGILAHRIAWALHFGRWPGPILDHVDGEKLNNAIANLREASPTVNSQNRRTPSRNNRTGLMGVYRRRKRFRATIKLRGISNHLGTFDTAEEAHAVYLAAKRRMHEGCSL